jgi:hypothetical protein
MFHTPNVLARSKQNPSADYDKQSSIHLIILVQGRVLPVHVGSWSGLVMAYERDIGHRTGKSLDRTEETVRGGFLVRDHSTSP